MAQCFDGDARRADDCHIPTGRRVTHPGRQHPTVTWAFFQPDDLDPTASKTLDDGEALAVQGMPGILHARRRESIC